MAIVVVASVVERSMKAKLDLESSALEIARCRDQFVRSLIDYEDKKRESLLIEEYLGRYKQASSSYQKDSSTFKTTVNRIGSVLNFSLETLRRQNTATSTERFIALRQSIVHELTPLLQRDQCDSTNLGKHEV